MLSMTGYGRGRASQAGRELLLELKTVNHRFLDVSLRLPRLRGLHARVEALAPPAGGYGVIASRAFASLADFTALTRHLLADGGVWMAMKGKLPADEQAALPADVEVFHVEQLQVPGLDAQRCLVWIRPRAGTD